MGVALTKAARSGDMSSFNPYDEDGAGGAAGTGVSGVDGFEEGEPPPPTDEDDYHYYYYCY